LSEIALIAPFSSPLLQNLFEFLSEECHLVITTPWSCSIGVSDPEIQKKVFGPRWQHEIEKQSWPLWKKLLHRLQRCPICKPEPRLEKVSE